MFSAQSDQARLLVRHTLWLEVNRDLQSSTSRPEVTVDQWSSRPSLRPASKSGVIDDKLANLRILAKLTLAFDILSMFNFADLSMA
jgi:hypothetical protein